MASDALGIVLVRMRTHRSKLVLEGIFGMTQTCVSDYLTFSIIILISVLHWKDDAKIWQPSVEKILQIKMHLVNDILTLQMFGVLWMALT